VVQDYALKVIEDRELFDKGLTFKGGTALRKFRAGHEGRFSTDLDFAADLPDLGRALIDALNGASLHDVHFSLEDETPGRRWRLSAATPLGSPNIDTLVEVSPRAPWLQPELRHPIHMAVHEVYEFEIGQVPVMALEESIAEKLAALRRRVLARDTYDLAWFCGIPFDAALVRRLTYLKVFVDVVEDGLGRRPFQPDREILNRRAEEFQQEDIGLLTDRVDIPGWLARIRGRFGFLRDVSLEEARWAQCDPRERGAVAAAIDGFRHR
jgi:predicted nucleotidyltransferase component of viral defense system